MMSGKHKLKEKKIRHCIGYADNEGELIECGKDITELHHNCTRCSECQELDRQFKKRIAAEIQRLKGNRLGTGYLGPHMRKKKDGTCDVEAEMRVIKKEWANIKRKPKHNWDETYENDSGCSDCN